MMSNVDAWEADKLTSSFSRGRTPRNAIPSGEVDVKDGEAICPFLRTAIFSVYREERTRVKLINDVINVPPPSA